MEFVPFTTEQLSYLAKQDPYLAPIFAGVFAADELPGLPEHWLFSPKNTLAKSWTVMDYR